MKVLQINAVYGVGSTGGIVRDIHELCLKNGIDSYVAYSTSKIKPDNIKNGYKIGNTLDHKVHALLRRISGKQGWHSKRATKIACKKILEINPDIVHLHNVHSNFIHLPTLLDFLGKNNIPTLVTLHDCWFFTGYCTHYLGYSCDEWEKLCENCPALRKSKIAREMFAQKKELFSNIESLAINGVSKWTSEAAKKSILKNAKIIEYIYNWIDTETFKPTNNTEEIKKRYNIPKNHKIVLGVSQAWSEKKGLDEFLLIADNVKDFATVVLVGEDRGVPQKTNLRCVGFTNSREELAELYSAADVFVNPSRMETFGLVTAEAMACATPVVAYNNTGSAEIVSEECGIVVQDGNKEELVLAVKKTLDMGKKKFSNSCRQWVCENFDKEKQIEKYINLYKKITSKNNLEVGGQGSI
jgi:glycosyltransferase involved in cell wall biosynthesis